MSDLNEIADQLAADAAELAEIAEKLDEAGEDSTSAWELAQGTEDASNQIRES